LEYEGWVSDGQSIEGIAKWFKTKSGDYFWAGGTDEAQNLQRDYQFVSEPGTVKIATKLHLRKNSPTPKTESVKVLQPGISVDTVGWVTDGKEVDGNSKWFKDADGNYFWSGGAQSVIDLAPSTIEDSKVGWGLLKLRIPELWQETKGRGIKVAILDTGVEKNHPDLRDIILGGKNLIEDNEEYDDFIGHGTHCAGIIAASGKQVFGVAPEATLLIGKITNDPFRVEEKNLIKGIQWALEQKAHIISMSLYRADSPGKRLTKLVKNAFNDSGTIMVGAVGNEGDLGFDIMNYPASFNECLSVGAINQDFDMDKITARSSKLQLLAPGRDIKSLWLDNATRTLNGTSMATAFVSGVLALLKSLNVDSVKLIEIILSTPSKFAKFNSTDKNAFGIINPVNALNKVKESI